MPSSSTDAILSALRTRLYRLENGEDEDELDGYGLDGSLDYEDDELNVGDYSVEHTSSELNTEIEMLQKLVEEAEQCRNSETDAKATALVEKIYSLRSSGIEANNKVLVFTEFRQTQDFLIRVLNEQGLKCEKVNGSMSMEERHHALVHFRDESDVLVATDAAGESLNMQFCHIIINYDLPWNPMALEQRIGRVDRIGQKYEVQAYNMLTNNSVDYRIYNIIVEKLDLIMEELGIDKTSDVLDSTIDAKKINHPFFISCTSLVSSLCLLRHHAAECGLHIIGDMELRLEQHAAILRRRALDLDHVKKRMAFKRRLTELRFRQDLVEIDRHDVALDGHGHVFRQIDMADHALGHRKRDAREDPAHEAMLRNVLAAYMVFEQRLVAIVHEFLNRARELDGAELLRVGRDVEAAVLVRLEHDGRHGRVIALCGDLFRDGLVHHVI